MKMVKVEILESRAGATVQYTAGETRLLPQDKASAARQAGWARVIEEVEQVAPKMTEPPARKVAPSPGLTDVEVVLARFFGDARKMKAFAKEQGIKVGRAKTADALAKAIVNHYNSEE